jgi:hypothetical protein
VRHWCFDDFEPELPEIEVVPALPEIEVVPELLAIDVESKFKEQEYVALSLMITLLLDVETFDREGEWTMVTVDFCPPLTCVYRA